MRPDAIMFQGGYIATNLTEREKDIWELGEISGIAKASNDIRAQVKALRDRPIASFDGLTGRAAFDQVLALLDGSGDE